MAATVNSLLALVRKSTGNRNTDGIYDDEFIESFNDAQKLIQARLVDVNSNIFFKTGYLSIVSGQVEYDLPSDLFMSTMIKTVEITSTANGSLDTYYPLQLVERVEQSYLYGYKISGGKLILSFTPSVGVANGIKLDYVKSLKRLELRRGTITSLAPLTVNTATVPDKTFWDSDYLTIVDLNGVQKVAGVVFTSFSAGVIITPPSVTAAAIGDYVIYGANSTTNHELPDIFDTYLREFCKLMIMHRDSSSDSELESSILTKVEDTLISIYANDNRATKNIPITDIEAMIY